MPEYYLTFGMQYASEKHPTLPADMANPFGYIRITAPDYEMARRLAYGLTATDPDKGPAYCEVHEMPGDVETLTKMMRFFPHGETARIIVDRAVDWLPDSLRGGGTE